MKDFLVMVAGVVACTVSQQVFMVLLKVFTLGEVLYDILWG